MYFFFIHSRLQIFVTVEAEVWASGQQKASQLCLVRIVATRTLSVSKDRLMPAFSSLYPFAHLWMARKAKRVLFIDRHSPDVCSVCIVAGEAHPFRKRMMIRTSCLLLHQLTVTLGTQFRVGQCEQTFLIRSMGTMAGITPRIHNGFMGIRL
jgi:hypothetical protein